MAVVGTATGTLIGKQLYISPEQFRGRAEPASDYYSLGATLFYLLTGKEPEALSCSHPKTINSEVSESMNALVSMCTALEPARRLQTAQELTCLLTGLETAQATAIETQEQPIVVSLESRRQKKLGIKR